MIDLNYKHSSVHVKHACNVYNKKWAEKDWAENKCGPKSDQPEDIIYRNRCHYVIKFLFINLIMKYPSLKNIYMFTRNMSFNLIFNSNRSHITITTCN